MTWLPHAFRHLPPAPGQLFVGYWRRRLALRLGILTLHALGAYVALVLVAVHGERFLRFPDGLRLASFIVVHGLVFGLLLRLLLQWRRLRRPAPELAYEIEAELGCHDERLVSAFALLTDAPESGHAPAMQARLAADADAFVRDLQTQPLPRDRRLRLVGLLVVALLATAAALSLFPNYQFGLMLERFYRPLASLPRPAFTRIALGAFPNPLARGSDLTLSARLEGRIARRAWMEFADGRERLPMTRIGRDAFLHTLYKMHADMTFRIRAGDGETAWQAVRVVDPPQLESLTILVAPPAYSGLPAESYDQPDEVRALVGSRLELRLVCHQELVVAELQIFDHEGTESRLPLDLVEGQASWTIERLEQDLRFRVLLRNRDGFDNLDRQERRLLAVADQPPRLRLDNVPELIRLYPTEARVFEADLEDDLGLVSTHVSLLVNPDPEFPAEPRRRELERYAEQPRALRLLAPVSLEGLGVEPGDVVEFYLEAVDTGGNIGRSARVTIEVVSFDPGLEEQQRLAFLLVLQKALAQRAALAAPAGPWPAEAAAAIAELAAAEGVDFPNLATADAAVLRQRLLLEQDLTDFHLYTADLRAVNVLLSGSGLNDTTLLAWLAGTYLPAQIQFRFHRNLNRVAIALGEIARQIGAAAAAADATAIDKQAVQLRASLEAWMSRLARTTRESPWPEHGFEQFADAVVEVNLAARRLASASATAEAALALATALERLRPLSAGMLAPLGERLTVARRQAAAQVAARYAADAPESAAALETLAASLRRDEAVAPEERFLPWLRSPQKAATAAAVAEAQAERLAWLHRRHHLENMLAERLAERGFGPALQTYDLHAFRTEHDQAWPEPATTDGPDAFAAAIRPHLPPPAAWLETRTAAFVEAQTRYATILREVNALLAGFAAPDTVDRRVALLDAYDALDREADLLLDVVRLLLSVDYGQPPLPVEARIGWLRVLIRLQERLDHQREASAESIGAWRPFYGQPFSQKENDLFQARLQPVLGANRGLERIAQAFEPVLAGETAVDDSFLAEAVADLPAAGQLEQFLRQAHWLGSAEPATDDRQVALRALLDDHAALQAEVLVAMLAPAIEAWQAALLELQDTVREGRAAGGAEGTWDWEAPAAGGRRLREQVSEHMRRLEAIRTEGTRSVGDLLRPLAERLQGLPATPEALATASAAALLTIDESLVRLRTASSQLRQLGQPATERLVAPRGAGLLTQARVEARNRAGQIAHRWEGAAVKALLDGLADGDDGTLWFQATFAWQAALAIRLSPVMISDVRGRLLRSRGSAGAVDRHWLVTEFEESQRLPLPRRHRLQTDRYYERLKGAFREHPHTR